MARFDKPCRPTTFYWSSTVTLCLILRFRNTLTYLVLFASYFTLNNTVTLKFGLEVTQGH